MSSITKKTVNMRSSVTPTPLQDHSVDSQDSQNQVQVASSQVQYMDKNQLFTVEDSIKLTGGSMGRFQIISTICFVIIFSVGSQFFISIPFY